MKIENSTNFSKLNDKMDSMKADIERMGDTLNSHDENFVEHSRLIAELQARIATLEARQLHADQYSRKNCLRIWGLPGNCENKDLPESFLKFATSTLKVNVAVADIDNIHYLGKGTGRHVIIKFATFLAKRKVYEARRVLKGVKNEAGQFISIRPDLSPASRALLAQARQMVSDGKDGKPFSSVWVTIDGKICATQGDKRLHLTGPRDLDYGDADTAAEENSTQRRKTAAKRLASASPVDRPDTKRVNPFELLAVEETLPKTCIEN